MSRGGEVTRIAFATPDLDQTTIVKILINLRQSCFRLDGTTQLKCDAILPCPTPTKQLAIVL
jgi:hypothetical protein